MTTTFRCVALAVACSSMFDERAGVIDAPVPGLVEAATDAARAPPLASESPPCACPLCAAIMVRTRVDLARCTIDVCAAHGIWLDRWELCAVATASDRLRAEEGGIDRLWTEMGLGRTPL